MSNLVVNGNLSLVSTLDCHGKWWTSQFPDNKVGGTFKFDIESGGVLTLDGGLSFGENEEFDAIIYGDIQGSKLTLDQCFRTTRSTQLLGWTEISKEIWICSTVFRNAHLKLGSKTKFTSVQFNSSVMSAWMNLARPSLSHGVNAKIEVSIEIPNEIKINLEDGNSLRIIWGEDVNSTDRQLDINVIPAVSIETEGKTLSEYHGQYLTPLLYLLTFTTGTPDLITSLSARISQDVSELPIVIQILEQRIWASSKHENRVHLERVMLTFREVEDHFERIVNSWIRIHKETRTLMNSYFSTYFTDNLFSDEKFLRIVSALEGWHKTFYNTEVASDYHEILRIQEAIKKNLNKHERLLLDNKLSRLKWPSLKERLDFLILLAIPRLKVFIWSREKFSYLCAGTRNGLIHHYIPKDSYARNDFFYAEQTLKCLFINLLMNKLGFEESEIERAMLRSYEGRWLHLESVIMQ